MKKEIVISEADDLAVVYENGRAVEFVLRQGDQLVGDVVLGKVESVVPAIEAAFINIGHDKNGFIHMADLPSPQGPQRRQKSLPIRTGEKLIVQIAKAPTGTKGARLTGRLSIPGRFLVFVPHDNRVCMSRMITDLKERDRLRKLAAALKDPGHGLIVRTEAVGATDEELRRDAEELVNRWTDILHMAQMKAPPALLYRDDDLLTRVLRDRLTSDTERIVVDSQDALQRAREILGSWNPDMVRHLQLHRGKQSIMESYRISREIESALKPSVRLPSGGSIVIEQTEALTVIDVNSGKLTSSRSLAETVLKTNIESAAEIARQIRLRDIGGIIVVDFISMDFNEDRKKVIAAMTEALKPDKSRPQITSVFSEHGLLELARRRQGQSLLEQLTERCPTCSGLGRVRNEVLAAEVPTLPVPAREETEAEVLVEEIVEEPTVSEIAPEETETEGEEGPRRRRRRRRRRRGGAPAGAPALGAEGEEGEEEFEPEVEEITEEAPSGITIEPMDLEGEEEEPAPAPRERTPRERGPRDRERRYGRRGERRREERPTAELAPETPVEPAPVEPEPVQFVAPPPKPEPVVAEAPAARRSSYRPKLKPRPRMQLVEIAPGLMQLVTAEEAEAIAAQKLSETVPPTTEEVHAEPEQAPAAAEPEAPEPEAAEEEPQPAAKEAPAEAAPEEAPAAETVTAEAPVEVAEPEEAVEASEESAEESTEEAEEAKPAKKKPTRRRTTRRPRSTTTPAE